MSEPRVVLCHGDAADAPRFLAAHYLDRRARLAYLDPPFSVGVVFSARVGKGQRATGVAAYDDRFDSLDAYLEWLGPRLCAAWDCLSEDGTLMLHLDHRAVHEAAVLGRRLFGRDTLAGEIIWLPGNGGKARSGPPTTHQTILIFQRPGQSTWHRHDAELREPYAGTSLAMHFTQRDEAGRHYRERVVAGKRYRYYADEGRARGSVWVDCPSMLANTPLRRETTGYPTQKPEKLLRRLIRATTNPGDLVLDLFAGSGTTGVSAAKEGRSALLVDVGDLAQETMAARLQREGIQYVHDTRAHLTRAQVTEPAKASPRPVTDEPALRVPAPATNRRARRAPAPRGPRNGRAS